MKRIVAPGTTGFLDQVFIRDTSVTSRVAGLTGLTSGSAGLTLYYLRAGANASVAVSLSAGTLGTWSSGGFVEVDAAHMPGVYELGLPNAAFAVGAQVVRFQLRGAANMEEVPWQYELDIDYAVETVIRGTVGSSTTPSTTQFTPSTLDVAMSDVNQLVGRVLLFRNNTTTAGLRGQGSPIIAASAAALPLITLQDALSRAPIDGDVFTIT